MSATSAKTLQPPFAEFGLFTRIFLALAVSLMAFSGTACITILTLGIYTSTTGHAVDFSICYRGTGLIAGIVMLVISSVWVVWVGVYRLQHPTRELTR